MCIRDGAAIAAATLACLAAAQAGEIAVVAKNVKFPEGPLWFDGSLLFVEYGGHTILRLAADGSLTRVWERLGCGPAALVEAGTDLLVTCYDENSLVGVSATGETLQVYDNAAAGAAFIGPNDFVADDKGGVSCRPRARGRPPPSLARSSTWRPTGPCGRCGRRPALRQ